MINIGIDLGGTNTTVTAFGSDWSELNAQSYPTPPSYEDLLSLVGSALAQMPTAQEDIGSIGICVPGFAGSDPDTVVSANCAIDGQTFDADIRRLLDRPVFMCNDAAAVAMSEAVFGAGSAFARVVSITFGTGIGAGMVDQGSLTSAALSIAGELGHSPAPAHLVQGYGLPLFECGCGRLACIESYASGRGLAAIAEHLTGEAVTAEQVVARRRKDPDAQKAWMIWCAFAAELLRLTVLAYDPDVIVIGGGMSEIDGVLGDLHAVFGEVVPPNYPAPDLKLAKAGPASGAKGAAYLAAAGRR